MKVELHISCRKLKNLDILTKSDPQVTIFKESTARNHRKKWIEYDKTELILDNLNPDFSHYFTVPYEFEKHQKLRFEVLDVDIAGITEFIGYIECSMGQIMGSKN